LGGERYQRKKIKKVKIVDRYASIGLNSEVGYPAKNARRVRLRVAHAHELIAQSERHQEKHREVAKPHHVEQLEAQQEKGREKRVRGQAKETRVSGAQWRDYRPMYCGFTVIPWVWLHGRASCCSRVRG